MVYVIAEKEEQSGGSRYVKIGVTKSIQARMASLRGSNPRNLELLVMAKGDRGLESRLHHIFREWRVEGSEWFLLPPHEFNRLLEIMWDKAPPPEHETLSTWRRVTETAS